MGADNALLQNPCKEFALACCAKAWVMLEHVKERHCFTQDAFGAHFCERRKHGFRGYPEQYLKGKYGFERGHTFTLLDPRYMRWTTEPKEVREFLLGESPLAAEWAHVGQRYWHGWCATGHYAAGGAWWLLSSG